MPNYSTATPYTSSAAYKAIQERAERMRQKLAAEEKNIKNQDYKHYNLKVSVDYKQDYSDYSQPVSEFTEVRKLVESPIRGKFAEALTKDQDLLKARSWGVYPSILTNGLKWKGLDWLHQEIAFVDQKPLPDNQKGRYLGKLIGNERPK